VNATVCKANLKLQYVNRISEIRVKFGFKNQSFEYLNSVQHHYN